MKGLAKLLLLLAVGAGAVVGGALLSRGGLQLPAWRSSDAPPSVATDASTQVPPERASGPPPGYEPPAPEDTPCLQPQYATRCVGRARARTGLMQLAGLQQQRMRERGSYAEDAAALGFQPASGMALRMRGGPGGWTAEYHHEAAGLGCSIYEGDVAEPLRTVGGLLADTPGGVACDDPLATGR